jgi:hypothetical protein
MERQRDRETERQRDREIERDRETKNQRESQAKPGSPASTLCMYLVHWIIVIIWLM